MERMHTMEQSPRKTAQVAIEISSEEIRALETVAQTVGGDFAMVVKIGKPGEGSFFDPKKVEITLDPLHVKENPSLAKFVAGHEGAHRAITPMPHELGITKEEISELYGQIGFGYLQNIIEDPAVNDWLRRRFPGMAYHVGRMYDEQFREENAVLSTPEVARIAGQLGYWPKFAQYGSELMRDWYCKEFSKTLDPAVAKALGRTIDLARESIAAIPNPTRMNRREIVKSGKMRFDINTKDIWPEVKKLVDMDLDNEQIRQMVNDAQNAMDQMREKQQELEQAQQNGDEAAAEQLQKEIEQLGQKAGSMAGLPEQVMQELRDAMDKAMQDAVGRIQEELDEQKQKSEKAKAGAEKIEKEIREIEEKLKTASGEEKEQLEKELEGKKSDKALEQAKQKEAEKKVEEIEEAQKELSDAKRGKPVPFDDLSEETKQKLEDAFQKLKRSEQKKYREQARRQLEEFEDKSNEALRGQMQEERSESHEERHAREDAERVADERRKKEREERERVVKELEKKMREGMSEYEKTRGEVVGMIDHLYFELRKILKPEEYGGEDMGYPTGQQLDVARAMQADADPTQLGKTWIRETAPARKDYRFWHLVDLSGSMGGDKIEETFKGFVVAGEAIDRIEDLNSDILTVRQGITGFHNRTFPYKGNKDRFTGRVKDELSTMKNRTRDSDSGTNTYRATVEALEGLAQDVGETGNFLLTFSDGEPNFDVREQLKALLKEGKEDRARRKIKVGLVWLGATESEENLKELVEEYGYDFGIVMPAVKPKPAEKGREAKDFATLLSERLKDIIENPEKY